IDEFVDARSAECTASLPHMAVGGHYPSRFRIVENAAGGNCSTALLAIPVRVDEVGINDRGNDVRWMGRLRVEWIPFGHGNRAADGERGSGRGGNRLLDLWRLRSPRPAFQPMEHRCL